MVPTRVLLVRHAQSAWNAEGRWQGWADPPLSELGEAEARLAGADPLLEAVDVVVASDLQRARRTAEHLAARRGLTPVTTFAGLRERGAGDWTGLTRQEIEHRWPGRLDGGVARIPNGEEPAEVVARAVTTFDTIATTWPERTVLAVSHGALIRLVEEHAGGQPVHVPNLAGRWLELSPGSVVLGELVAPLAPAREPRP